MSGITPSQTPQPNPDAGAGASPSLSDATWEIWVREYSTLPNQQEDNQPGNFIRRRSEISTLSELETASSSLDHSPQHRVEYIFCRKGMTSELFEPNSGFGNWYDENYEVMNISEWENKAGDGSSLSEDIWKIWVGEKSVLQSLLSNQPEDNQPWTFIPRESEISTVSELTSELNTLDYSPTHRVLYIFCRQGVTSEQLDRKSGFGYWDHQPCEEKNILSGWKNMCEDLLTTNLEFPEPHVYGVIVDHTPNGQSNCFYWRKS